MKDESKILRIKFIINERQEKDEGEGSDKEISRVSENVEKEGENAT